VDVLSSSLLLLPPRKLSRVLLHAVCFLIIFRRPCHDELICLGEEKKKMKLMICPTIRIYTHSLLFFFLMRLNIFFSFSGQKRKREKKGWR
jgi:hypothetical protein